MRARTVLTLALAESLIVLVAAVVTAFAKGFDGLYGQDAFAYVDYALGPLTAALSARQMPPDFFWPPAFPLLIAGLGGLGLGDGAGQLIALACGCALPFLVVMVGRQLPALGASERMRDLTALLAGLVTAVSGHLWQSSIVAMADTMGAAFATVGAWAALRFARTTSWPFVAVGAAAFAIAIQARWMYGLVALPLVALTLWHIYRAARVGQRRTALASVVAGSLTALLVLAPTGLPIVVALVNGQTPPFSGNFAVYSWNPLGALSTSFDTADGRLSYALPTGLFYLLQPIQPYWLGAIGLLLFPGARTILRKPSPGGLALLIWPLLVFGFHLGGAYQNTRFFLAALAPAVLIAAIGATSTFAYLRDRGLSLGRFRLATLFAAALAAAIAFNAAYGLRFTGSFVDREVADVASIRELAAKVESDGRLIALGATTVLLHDGRDAVELYRLEPESARELVLDDRPDYLLVDSSAVTGQFASLAAGRTFAALSAEPGIRPVATSGIWTLYVIGE
ncbi:MAG: hypothetical protein ABIP53_12405 [Candidatus Limnocylindrales bacterium]